MNESQLASDLPLRNAAAVVVSRPDGQVLLAQRNKELPEFPGVWSFPSIFERSGISLWNAIAGMLSLELGLKVDRQQLLVTRTAPRPSWRLVMHLYRARLVSGPSLNGNKYTAYRWVDGVEYLATLDEKTKVGDCLLAYKTVVEDGDLPLDS